MPSIRTIIMSFALLASLQVSASPVPEAALKNLLRAPVSFTPIKITNPGTIAVRATPALPLSGGATNLPNPSFPLQYVAIGRGIQNYSCTAVGATPAAIGAIATLYDATALAKSNIAALNALPGKAVLVPGSRGGCFDLPLANRNLKKLGNHLFLADGTPAFELTAVRKSITAAKNATVAAPSSAPVGPSKSGAVAWLQLNAKPAPYTPASVGLHQVYRVETAGGNPPATCAKAGVLSVQYAAQYWFY